MPVSQDKTLNPENNSKQAHLLDDNSIAVDIELTFPVVDNNNSHFIWFDLSASVCFSDIAKKRFQ